MPKSKACPHYFSIIFAVCAMAILLSEQLSWSESYKDILELEYSSVSGNAGRESVLKIYTDGNVYYQKDGGYKYNGLKTDYSKSVINFTNSTITAEERRRLKTVLKSNHFFSMKESYVAKHPVSDKGGSCIKISKPLIKNVCVEDTSDVPKSYYNIIEKLEQFIDSLPKNYLRVQSKYKLKQWPYSSEIKLSELKDKSFLNEELFNYFIREINKENALLFEDGTIFLPVISCQGLPFKEFYKNEDCRFGLYPAKIISWPTSLNIKLSDIGEDGVFIGSKNYQEIKKLLENRYSEDLILENSVVQGSYAYRLYLSLDRKIEEVKRKNK